MSYEANRFVLGETNNTDYLEPMATRYQQAGEVLGDLALSYAMGGQLAIPFGIESAILPIGADPVAEEAVQVLSTVVTYEDIHRAKQ